MLHIRKSRSGPPSRGRTARVLARLSILALATAGLSIVNANPAAAAVDEPCDIYGNAGTPCVAAYSTVRAMYSSYSGSLYQVTRASDNTTRDIGLLATGGYANAATQNTFCSGTTCTITKLYDQSPKHNDLGVAGGGGANPTPNRGANASILPVTAGGHPAYGIYMPPGTGYRRNSTTGIATGSAPESMYEVVSGTNVNNNCCSDFGNVETNSLDTGPGHMDAILLSKLQDPGSTGTGPWVEADLEDGVFQGATNVYTPNAGNASKFVTAVLKNNGTTNFALKGGNSQTGNLTTWYSGALPSGYSPMKKEGGIVLGTGGDNSNWGTGSFYEGVMTTGYATDAAENAVQANIVSVGYAADSTGGAPGSTIVGPGGKCVNVDGSDTGANNAAVTLWDCNALDGDQHWSPGAIGNGTLSTLGKCLDIVGNSTTPGAKLQLYTCNSAVGGQKWVPQLDGSIKNPQSGLCLDDPNGNTANGTVLQVWTCNQQAPQKFKITDGTPIVLANGVKCVDTAGQDTGGNNAVVQVYDCHNAASYYPLDRDQQWTLNADQTIRTLGRCLDIKDNGTTPGSKVQLYDCNGQPGQKWVPQANGSLLNPPSGLCLDDPSGNVANLTPLQVYTCNNQDPQIFRINGA